MRAKKTELETAHVVDWRKLWAEVLSGTDTDQKQVPLHAMCWAVEELFRLGFEEPRVLVFVQFVWKKFRAELGPVDEHPRHAGEEGPPAGFKPAAAENPGGRPKSQREWEDAARQYEQELERMANAELEGYRRFCGLVEGARDRFGDDRTWLVNVLGWSLQALYRTGYRDDELGGLVQQTWAVMAQASRTRETGLPPPTKAQLRGFAQDHPPRRRGGFT